MVRNMCILMLVVSVRFGYSQNADLATANLPLKFNLGLAESSMSFFANRNLYYDGSLEYFVAEQLSFTGNCLLFIDSRDNHPILDKNILLLFGSAYHFVRKSHDFSIGIQPGFAYVRPTNHRIENEHVYPMRLMPVISISVGYTFYFAKYCNFFVNARYLFSSYRGSELGSVNLNEFLVSGGLGFQIFTKKK